MYTSIERNKEHTYIICFIYAVCCIIFVTWTIHVAYLANDLASLLLNSGTICLDSSLATSFKIVQL